METFSFSPPINLVEEGKLLLAVTSFEASNFVFIITDDNNSFFQLPPQFIGHEKMVKSLLTS